MPFNLTTEHLSRLCRINHFDVSQTDMVFFGLRACLPTNVNDQSTASEHQLALNELNYTNPRCTIGQWDRGENKFAVFPGSTVPHITAIKRAKIKNGVGANQLMTGFYPFYERKRHQPETAANHHDAFGLGKGLNFIRRNTDDLDFDGSDRISLENPHDNIHAAYGMHMDGNYSSSGCQVILGFPQCTSATFRPEGGPWRAFKARAYGRAGQNVFQYFLLDGKDASIITEKNSEPVQARLRFGSSGPLVERLQEKLGVGVDGGFGEQTLRAVLAFQNEAFGVIEATGVVGERTAVELGVEWETI